MSQYTKLFSHIITSSIWSEDDQTRILWITMLALSDKYGEVMASVPGLAKVSNLSVASVQAGIDKLTSPDEYSRTPDEEGRRIIKIDGGWSIVNYEKHRKMASIDERRMRDAERKRRWRERKKSHASCPTQSTVVTNGHPSVTLFDDKAEADIAEAEKRVPNPRKEVRRKPSLCPSTEASKRIAALFDRPLTRAWSEKEVKAFKAIGDIALEDLTLIERYYERERSKGKEGIHRRSLPVFLNNFSGELDRARGAIRRRPHQFQDGLTEEQKTMLGIYE